MKTLFDVPVAEEIKQRLRLLEPGSARLWGTMDAAQTVAHCSAGIEMAMGNIRPKRSMGGRLIGRIVKRMALAGEEPMRRNSPTASELIMQGARDLETERERLGGLIDGFTATGSAGCTAHPHAFFGPLTPDEWATLMYKHLDHHLRQFGV